MKSKEDINAIKNNKAMTLAELNYYYPFVCIKTLTIYTHTYIYIYF